MFIGFPSTLNPQEVAGQTDLETLMEYSGHTQVSTVFGNYVIATSESMTKAINGMDRSRPDLN